MVWTTKDLNPLHLSLNVHPCFSQDSSQFFVASGNEVRVYQSRTGDYIKTLKHDRDVIAIGIPHPSVHEVVTITVDGTFKLWNYEKNLILKSMPMKIRIKMAKFDQTSNLVVVLTQKEHCNIRIYDFTALLKDEEKMTWKANTFHNVGKGHNLAICGATVAVITKHAVCWWNSLTGGLRSIRHGNFIAAPYFRRYLTSVAIDPEYERGVIVGDNFGRIYHLNVQRGSELLIANYIWLSNTVKSLEFFSDGLSFLSGGKEGVLVQWYVESKRTEKYRSVGSIEKIVISQNDQQAVMLTSDNAIVMMDLNSMKPSFIIEGKKFENMIASKLPSEWLRNASMQIEPKHGYLVTNGTNGYLQFYDMHHDRVVSSLEAVPPNYATYSGQKRSVELAQPHVNCFAFSPRGNGLALTVHRDVEVTKNRNYITDSLRFYWRGSDDSWVLETRVELPHGNKVTHVVYHPSNDVVATCGRDGKFRIWNRTLIKESNQKDATGQPHGRWVCRSVGNYKDSRITGCAFSFDGSLLAVAYANMLTLWNPVSNILLGEIYHGILQEPIKHIAFITDTPYVVTATKEQLYVWNVLDSSLQWTCEARVTALVAHPQQSMFAVSVTSPTFTLPQLLKDIEAKLSDKRCSYIASFSPSSPKPLYTWKVPETKTPLAMSFKKKNKGGNWNIVCCGPEQQIFLLEEAVPEPEEVEQVPTVPILEERKPGYLETILGTEMEVEEESGAIDSAKRRLLYKRRDQFLDTLAETPSHVLPPPTELFRSFMETVISKNPGLVAKETSQTQQQQNGVSDQPASKPKETNKLRESQLVDDVPSNAKNLPRPVLDLVGLFQQLTVDDFKKMASPPLSSLSSSGKKRNDTPQRESKQPEVQNSNNNKSSPKDSKRKKKKDDEEWLPSEEEGQSNGTTEKSQPVAVGAKRTVEDKIKESNGNHESSPRTSRKQSLRSANKSPASSPPTQTTPLSARRKKQ